MNLIRLLKLSTRKCFLKLSQHGATADYWWCTVNSSLLTSASSYNPFNSFPFISLFLHIWPSATLRLSRGVLWVHLLNDSRVLSLPGPPDWVPIDPRQHYAYSDLPLTPPWPCAPSPALSVIAWWSTTPLLGTSPHQATGPLGIWSQLLWL